MLKYVRKELLIGFINFQSLPKTRWGSKNFDLSHLISDMKLDHIGLAETSRHWFSLQEEYSITQNLRGKFMSQQLESITACNQHDPFLDPFQYGVTSSL